MTWFFYPLGMWGLRYFKCKVEVFDPLGLEFSIGWQMWVYLHFSTCRHSVRPAAGGEYALLYSWNYFGIFVKINCLLCPPPSALWARISRPQLATSLPHLGWSPQTKVRPIVLQEPATSWKMLASTWCQPPASGTSRTSSADLFLAFGRRVFPHLFIWRPPENFEAWAENLVLTPCFSCHLVPISSFLPGDLVTRSNAAMGG